MSAALAFGIKALAESLGKTVVVYQGENSDEIQGRKVNVLPFYSVRWRLAVDEQHRQTFREDGMEWAPVRAREDLGEEAEVFNISVDEDDSYVVEGIVVHNCKHFSSAKGGVPLSKKIRGLAWIVTRWAAAVRPLLIFCENVQEFLGWGPLVGNRPDKTRAGKTFRAWVSKLRSLGYLVEWRVLVAADYGAPTLRKRLFVIARCDGLPIVWPEPTHGEGRSESWKPAASVIDWSEPCPSIFNRELRGLKPLAPATMRRIAAGIERFVLGADAEPFLVKYHGGPAAFRGQSLREPLKTIDTSNRFGLVEPFMLPLTHQGDARVYDIREPFRCITGANRGELALAAPVMVQHNGGANGHPAAPHSVLDPFGTVTSRSQASLAAVWLTKLYGTCKHGASVRAPFPTVTAGGGKGGGHIAHVQAFLTSYYGNRGKPSHQSVRNPLRTLTAKARFGIVTVHGVDYQITDVGMRMMKPRELFDAQGFRPGYIIDPMFHGKKLTKTAQTSAAGNSVCPQMSFALVKANVRGSVAIRRAA